MAESKKKSASTKGSKKSIPAPKKVSSKKQSALEAKLQDAREQVKKLTKKLAKTEAKLEAASKKAATKVGRAAADVTVVTRKAVDQISTEVKTRVGTPSASWTLVELRAYAKNKGIAGYSTKNKADLLTLITKS